MYSPCPTAIQCANIRWSGRKIKLNYLCIINKPKYEPRATSFYTLSYKYRIMGKNPREIVYCNSSRWKHFPGINLYLFAGNLKENGRRKIKRNLKRGHASFLFENKKHKRTGNILRNRIPNKIYLSLIKFIHILRNIIPNKIYLKLTDKVLKTYT